MCDPAQETTGREAEDHRGLLAAASAAGAEGGEAAAATEEEVIGNTRADDIEFNIAVDVIYNRDRAAWLLWCHRALMFATIMLGSVAATDLANAKVCAVLAAACAAFDLVFDPATTAAAHREIIRQLHEIVAALRRDKGSEAAADTADKALMNLSATEPAPYNMLRALAYKEAVKALGRDPVHCEDVPLYLRPFVNVLRFEGR